MRPDEVEGKRKWYKGKERCGNRTDDDLNAIEGWCQVLVGKIQEYYGTVRDRTEKEAEEFAGRGGT
jgi:uncharacterized protein YjbJ (UPF0337 family)